MNVSMLLELYTALADRVLGSIGNTQQDTEVYVDGLSLSWESADDFIQSVRQKSQYMYVGVLYIFYTTMIFHFFYNNNELDQITYDDLGEMITDFGQS